MEFIRKQTWQHFGPTVQHIRAEGGRIAKGALGEEQTLLKIATPTTIYMQIISNAFHNWRGNVREDL